LTIFDRRVILGRRHQQIRMEGLSRFLVYVLGHRPDEFGLVPDEEGFVVYKELLQALHEEEGWRYVRRSHINEILLGSDRALFESENDRIRSMERRWELDFHHPVASLPKILFTAIRRRAHPVVMEKGLKGPGDRPLVLSPNRDMAVRIGCRRDQAPVVLEIVSEAAAEKRVLFYSFGDLFLSPEIPARFIAGPPVSKEMLESRKEKDRATDKPSKGLASPTPGTFILDPSRDPDLYRKTKGKKQKGWKEAARTMRKGAKR
jgi:putative RNA 2'-phosphotransferase